MTTPQPTSQPLTIDEFLSFCPKFRILVVGKSGVGKSSLVSNIFNINKKDIDIADGRAGKADIAHEYISNENTHFILHDSEGFEPGSAEKWETVEKFIKDKCNETLLLKDRLHAIWLCIETPRTGARLMQTADEKLLSLANRLKLAVIVIFTKYDLLYNECYRRAPRQPLGKQTDHKATQATAETNAEKHLQMLVKDHNQDLKYIGVSTHPKYPSLKRHAMLAKVTEATEQCLLTEQSWVTLAVAQRINAKQKVKCSIDVGLETWLSSKIGIVAKKDDLQDCLSRIHSDIIKVWNFNDPDNLLQPGKDFHADMLDLVQPLFAGISNVLSKIFQATRSQTALCLEAYIVDLMLILHDLFTIMLPTDPPKTLDVEVPRSFKHYKNSKSDHIHQLLRESTASRIKLPLTPKEIKENIVKLIRTELDIWITAQYTK